MFLTTFDFCSIVVSWTLGPYSQRDLKSETKTCLRFEIWSQLRPSLNFVFTNKSSAEIKLRPVSSLSNVNKPYICKYNQHFFKDKSVCVI